MTLLPQEMNVGLPIRQLGLRREGELGTRLRRVKARTLKKTSPPLLHRKLSRVLSVGYGQIVPE